MLTDMFTLPIRAWHRKGYDVQSPWDFSFVTDVLFETHAYYAYDELRLLCGTFATPRKHAAADDEQLFRIANFFAPQSIVAIGRPQSACYMARPHSSARCTAVVADNADTQTLRQLGISTADETGALQAVKNAFGEGVTAVMAHIALPDSKQSAAVACDIYEWAASHADASTVVVIEHINRSSRRLWKHIVSNDERATVTFDLGHRGIVTFDPKRIKQNYLL